MRELPIIFSGQMVRALLAGTKTQTRRLVKPQPTAEAQAMRDVPGTRRWYAAYMRKIDEFTTQYTPLGSSQQHEWKCPYQPGDRLYVRENLLLWPGHAEYEAGLDGLSWVKESNELMEFLDTYKRAKVPSIHMPKWAARIWLTVTDVRAQRLQGISEEDAKAENFERREHFLEYIDVLHGDGTADSDPWVWAYTFSVDKNGQT